MSVKILGLNGKDPEAAKSSFVGLDAGSNKIINVVDPTNPQDVATKASVTAAVDASVASNALDGTFRIKNTTDNTKQIAFDASGIATATTRTVLMPNSNVNLGLVATAIQSSEKAAALGVATLGADGKLLASQVPALAISSTFVVASQAAQVALSTAEEGDVAIRTDLNKSYILTNNVPSIFANWQELLTPTSAVTSVNGQVGTVVLTTSDITEGTNLYYTTARFDTAFALKTTSGLAEGTNLYYTQARFNTAFGAKSTTDLVEGTNLYYTQARFDTAFSGKSTTNLAEGSNLYFTDARVRAAVLTGFVSGADAAVVATDTVLQGFQKLNERALNIKTKTDFITVTQAVNLDTMESDIAASKTKTDFITITQAVNLDTMESDIAQLQSDVQTTYETGVAGEILAANEIWYVRRAKNLETAGRYYKAQANSSINANVVGIIVVGGVAVAAGDSVRIYKLGTATLGSLDTAFVAADLSAQIYLHQTTAGKMTLTPTSVAGDILKEVGYVATTGSVEYVNGLKITA